MMHHTQSRRQAQQTVACYPSNPLCKVKHYLRVTAGGLLLLTLLIAHIVLADDADPAQSGTTAKTLDTIRVLGRANEGFNVTIDDKMIESREATDLEDIFSHDPSITVGGGAPVAQKIYVRGLEDTLLNVTIDGATQAGYLYHHQGRLSVEPDLIKSVVIKAGAGNATDGFGALGGAIHIDLKDAKDLLRPGERYGARLKTRFATNNSGWKNHMSLYGLLYGDIGLLVSGTRLKSTQDYKAGNGNRVPETEQLQQDLRVKLSGNILPDHYISFSYENYLDKGRRFARPNMGALRHPVYQNVPLQQKTDRESFIGKYQFNPDNDWINFKATAYHNNAKILKRGDQWAATWPLGPPPTWTFKDYYNGAFHGGGVKSLGFNLKNTTAIGDHIFEYGYENRSDRAYLVEPVTDFNTEKTDIYALFLQADFQIFSRVNLSTGVRYDDYDYRDNNGIKIRDSGVSPNVTLSVDVLDDLEVSVGYAQAFKGVSSPEAFFLEFPPAGTTLRSYAGERRTDVVRGGFTVGSLKAEKSDNMEASFRYRSGNFAASGEIFRQTIENAQFTSPTARYSFVDDVIVKGYAFRMAYYWRGLSANAGVAHSRPKLGGQPLASGDMGLGTAYGRTWTLGLQYEYNDTLKMGWDARFVQPLKFVREGQSTKAGYDVHDIFIQWRPIKKLSVGMAIHNLFDKFYFDQGSFFTRNNRSDPVGLPEPGRDFRFYASYHF